MVEFGADISFWDWAIFWVGVFLVSILVTKGTGTMSAKLDDIERYFQEQSLLDYLENLSPAERTEFDERRALEWQRTRALSAIADTAVVIQRLLIVLAYVAGMSFFYTFFDQ